jgi:signal transduction histidine kinase
VSALIEDDLGNERLERLLAGAGHQLRTPLNSVLGFTEILLMGLPRPLNEEQRRQLRNVRSGSRKDR